MTENNLQKINLLLKELEPYSDLAVEASVIEYVSKKTGVAFCYDNGLSEYEGKFDPEVISIFEKNAFPADIEFITEFFESLLDSDNVTENGIVFTPEYIAEYIFTEVTQGKGTDNLPKIIDPGCGCGIFLVSAALIMHKATGVSFNHIYANCIYGIDLDKDNARRCNIVLNLLPLLYGCSNDGIKTNIECTDSLKCQWTELFGVQSYSYIIGNPPYVNTHDMSKETAKFLKDTFITTKTGVYNIFYAFIEHAMQFLDEDGMLGYIIPNNFLTIKSATELRKLIMEHSYLHKIIDFANNMVFKPVRTYNCIIQLDRKPKESFEYCVLDTCDDIKAGLYNAEFSTMPLEKLDVNGWKLVDKKTRLNLQRIEGQFKSIKEFIRTGIATLRDDVYMVEREGDSYYKTVNDVRTEVEPDLVKRLYKIPELKEGTELEKICRYIIFPYKKGKNGFEIIEESILQSDYPKTYKYLQLQKHILDERDKGKPNPVSWYAYGRTQGLNKYGVKLLFPTFANSPRFTLVNDEFALFCNGYAVFENDYMELPLLQRILNSCIMQYYVSNTSYAIEGGYYCYQKKYIEKFSIPFFNEEEKERMQKMSDNELNEFLIDYYKLDL